MDFYWQTNFPLSKKSREILDKSFLKRTRINNNNNFKRTLLIYDSPDRIIANYQYTSILNFKFLEIKGEYNKILSKKDRFNCKLISSWQIENLTPKDIEDIVLDKPLKISDEIISQHYLPNDSIISLCIILYDLERDIFDKYIELEMSSILINKNPDTNLLDRYQAKIISPNQIVESYIRPLNEIFQENIAQKNQLSQINNETKDLKKIIKDLEDEKKELLKKEHELSYEVSKLKEDLKNTKSDILTSISELNQNKDLYNNVLAKLYDSQNELEKYYLDSESYKEIIEENDKQLLRVKEILNILMKKSNSIEKDNKLNSNFLKNSINLKLKRYILKNLNSRLFKN